MMRSSLHLLKTPLLKNFNRLSMEVLGPFAMSINNTFIIKALLIIGSAIFKPKRPMSTLISRELSISILYLTKISISSDSKLRHHFSTSNITLPYLTDHYNLLATSEKPHKWISQKKMESSLKMYSGM